MTLFKSDATLLFLLMICLTINIVYADPRDSDNYECLHQIQIAYKSDSSTGCFRYAVEHYKKGKHIPVDDSSIPSISDQNRSDSSLSTSVHSEYFTSSNCDEEIFNELKDISAEDISLYVDNFDGFQDFIKKDQQNFLQNNYGSQATVETDEHQYAPNYATVYFMALEKLAQGTKIYSPVLFCENVFNDDPKCRIALKEFGRFGKTAAAVALTKYTLEECNRKPFVYDYMLHIRDNIVIKKPSKNPFNFCREIYQNKDWYLQLKGYKQTIKTK